MHDDSPRDPAAGPDAEVQPPKKKRRKRRLLLFGLPVVFILLLVVTVEMTSTSRFCSACHYMTPFFESWKTSSHKDVQCKVCHYPPGMKSFIRTKIEGLVMVGRYWTRLYVKSKPWAEIQDESCLRPGCHDRRLLEGKVEFGKVAFDHKAHFEDLKRGKKLRCTSCHSQIVQGEHITVTSASCFLCHFKDKTPQVLKTECAVCHRKDDLIALKDRFDQTPVFDNGYSCDKCHGRIVSGEGEVPKENCFKCHFENDRLEKYGDTDLMHRTHIATNKIECEQCHREIQHKIVKDIETISDCQGCHQGTHGAQKILYTGQGGKGVPHATPNVMLEKGLNCQGCHMFHAGSGRLDQGGDTLTASGAACESCHGHGFDRILKNWENSTEKRLAEIKAISVKAAVDVQSAAGPKKKEAAALFDEARFNIDIVEKGKSVHNMAYSQELLTASLEKIREALAAAGSSYRPEATTLLNRETPNACLTCHAGIEEISPAVFGLQFSHRKHAVGQKLECKTCHSNVRRHGELTATKAFCATCHHREAKKSCGECHALQKTMFEGGALGEVTIPKDMMAEAGASCPDCHLDKAKKVIRPDGGACVACHDEKYRATYTEWRDGVRSRTDEVRSALHVLYKKPLTDPEKAEVLKIEEALGTIDLDGSSGIHNYLFIDEYLTKMSGTIKSLSIGKEEKK
ncbi:MAG: cytochrome c3 family protein [Candidatus Aminicenantes bacterium]|nr:cytochrome c3 family protein [Candidatus Aminicenantes bacterium]